jgi:hypothetical protein
MSLLTELVAFYVNRFYKDFAPTELGPFFCLKSYEDRAPIELLFQPGCLMSSCSAPGTALLSAKGGTRGREAIATFCSRHP